MLAPVTQERYLAALRDILDLAAKKRLISVNPAEGLKPIRRDTVAASEKRKPFTLQQIADFFKSGFYAECAKHSPAFAHDKQGWRFWLPFLCLFLGARPNEMAQMHVADLKRTQKGTWYLDIEGTADEEESSATSKTLKTVTSRRKIPLHPELIKIGFAQFVEQRKKASSDPRLFLLMPDKYGNHATYPLKRFRDAYLPDAIKLEARQTFYSFRHSWRDALRRIKAPDSTLVGVGGWSQATSENYGDKLNPDFQIEIIKKISFPGLDLSALHLTKGM
jgi:integrase